MFNVAKIIGRGAKSACHVLTKEVNPNTTVQLFRNPKNNSLLVKTVNKQGMVSCYGYKASPRTDAIIKSFGEQTLKQYPEHLPMSYAPDKIVDICKFEGTNLFMDVIKNGKFTRFDDFFGSWLKGATQKQTTAEAVQKRCIIA